MRHFNQRSSAVVFYDNTTNSVTMASNTRGRPSNNDNQLLSATHISRIPRPIRKRLSTSSEGGIGTNDKVSLEISTEIEQIWDELNSLRSVCYATAKSASIMEKSLKNTRMELKQLTKIVDRSNREMIQKINDLEVFYDKKLGSFVENEQCIQIKSCTVTASKVDQLCREVQICREVSTQLSNVSIAQFSEMTMEKLTELEENVKSLQSNTNQLIGTTEIIKGSLKTLNTGEQESQTKPLSRSPSLKEVQGLLERVGIRNQIENEDDVDFLEEDDDDQWETHLV